MTLYAQKLGKVAPTWEGAWEAGRAYGRLCAVSRGGSTYVSVAEVPAGTEPPGEGWQLLASGVGYDDLTEAQIAELMRPATEAAADLSEVKATLARAEASRVSAESGRAAAETARQDAESRRAKAEAGRASAERDRAAAESSRATAESSRESAESSRASAEQARATAESGRAGAEQARAAAEAARSTSEGKRASAEVARAKAEASRDEEEALRVAAESARAAAEKTRATAEASRETAESDRAGDWAAIKSGAEAATTAATSAAARAEAAVDALSGRAPIYGVRFEGSAAKGTRLYDAVGKTATVSTNSVAGHSDFDGCDPFDFVRVKRRADASGVWHVVAVEGTPSWDLVEDCDYECRFSNGHWRHTDDGKVDERLVSAAPFEGSHPFLTASDGSVPRFIYIPCYETTLDAKGASRSKPGAYPAIGSYRYFAQHDRLAGPDVHSDASWYHNWLLIMPAIEYANRDAQAAIGQGFSGGNATNSEDKLLEAVTQGNVVKVAPARAATYVVGQGAFVGKNTWDPLTSANIACDERTITAIDAATGEVTLDGEPFDATTDMMLSNLDWRTGSCDHMLGHTGQPVASTKYPVKYRGIESPWGGGNEPIIDVRLTVVEGEDGAKGYETWFCPDPLKARDCTQLAPDENFVRVGLPWPAKDGYVTRVQRAEGFPELFMPAETGGGSTTYYADYAWKNASMPDNRALRAGYNWANGGNLGPSCRCASYSASDSGRYYLARPFKQP